MRLIAVGRMKAGPEKDLFDRYSHRLRPKIDLTEIPEAPGSPPEQKRREAAAILAALPTESWVVALDLGAQAPTSESLAALLRGWTETRRKITFIIGGAEGLDQSVLHRADHHLSLGPLTWPHMLARAMLAEQLFRAQSINTGHPYHRAGRP
jgi:23S rRNA (pseudouridine1915-N3)-methyltransferase